MDTKFALRASGGREYPILSFTRIGREADCLIRYTDAAISGHHASVWVVQDGLWLNDDNSDGGVFVNGQRIAPGQRCQLHPGDRLRLGNTQIELEVTGKALQPAFRRDVPKSETNLRPVGSGKAAARPAGPARRLTPIACVTMLGCLLVLGFVVLSSSYFFLRGGIAGLIPGQARVLTNSTPQPLLKPQEYAASSETLAQVVAQLNQSELAFIRAANGITSTLPKGHLARPVFPIPMAASLDEQLRQVAADAFHVATLADSLSQTAAAQDGGSPQAGQVAAQYGSIAQLGAALVIDAQDLRAGLAQGDVTQTAAAATVAEYGARLWNPSVTDPAKPGNPFTAYLSDPSSVPVAQLLSKNSPVQIAEQLGADLSTWVAASSEEIKKKFDIPDASTIEDAMLVADLLTPEGQQDSKTAKQAAASMLKPGGTNSSGTPGGQVVATFASAITVGAQDNPATTPPRTMSTFPNGSVTVITQPSSDDIISNLITLDGENNPTVASQMPVQETKPLVSLEISNISIKQINKRPKDGLNTFEADVVYEFDVKWTTNLAAPQFALDCAGGNHFDVSAASGSQHVTAKGLLILYPGAEDTFCYASRNGNTWGSASVHFLVGDSAEATQRAIQVETDSASLDLTLTADAQGTLAVKTANAAATQTVIAIENMVATEVYGTQTAEFIATITVIARQTKDAPTPADTETPLPTATFVPVLVDSFFHPGDVHTVVGKVRLQRGRLYRICLSGTMYITSGPVYPSDVDYVNGIKVPLSGCVVVEGNGAVATVSCSKGEPAEDPGGFAVQVFDLGPK